MILLSHSVDRDTQHPLGRQIEGSASSLAYEFGHLLVPQVGRVDDVDLERTR